MLVFGCAVLFTVSLSDNPKINFDYEWQLAKVTEVSWLIFTDSISYVGGVAFGKDIGAETTPYPHGGPH